MANNRNRGKHGRAEDRNKRSVLGFRFNLKQKRIAACIALFIVVFAGIYGRKIIRLKAENRELRAQQEQLKEEKSRLTKELKNVNSEEYIEEQAREKLRMLNKDEILFYFEEGNQ